MRKRSLLEFLFWAYEKVYTSWHRLTNRVYFTEDEINYLIDIVDVWVEEHRALNPDDDEVEGVYMNMAVAVDVRDKLWRQLNE